MAPDPDELLEKMRNSASNWKLRDIVYLYTSFGFTIRSGHDHDVAVHPKYRTLRATIPRTGELLKVYVRTAVKNIDKLRVLQKGTENAKQDKAKGDRTG
jgi:hypothetical protein